jgi:putative spermidine/putrescine transport system permease protein
MSASALRSLAALALALWLVLPLMPLAIWSVAHGWRFPALWPPELSSKAWAYALSPGSGILQSMGLTLFIAAATTALAALIGVPAGRALGLGRFRGKALVLLLVLAPAILPGIAVAMGLHGAFLRLGLTGTVTGVVLAHLIPVLPYMILVMAAVFAGFDTDAEAEARSLGARPWQVLWHVTLPAVRPGLMTAALFAFLVSWSQYLLTLAIGAGKVQTLPLVLFAFATSGRNDVTGAIALIYILPGLVVVALTARHLTGRSPALAARISR